METSRNGGNLPQPPVSFPRASDDVTSVMFNPNDNLTTKEQRVQDPNVCYTSTLLHYTGLAVSHTKGKYALEDPEVEAAASNALSKHFVNGNLLIQDKIIDFDYIQSCPDIRCETDNEYALQGWAMQEGSIVIGIDPSLVVDLGREQHPDQLALKAGKLYVIKSIYSDMWSLCIEVSVKKPRNMPDANKPPNEITNFGFAPLCAITLAANYSSFLERCQAYQNQPGIVPLRPSNGQRVMPPPRLQSLVMSKEIAQQLDEGNEDEFYSSEAYIICRKFRPIGENVARVKPKEPLDKLKSLVKDPCRLRKILATRKVVLKAIFTPPEVINVDNVGTSHPTRPRKKLVKGERHSLAVSKGLKRLCC
ncbi:uncharacterized protein N7482_001133 [Penicillium canariense]|uniref:Uncharacterized protein n=1 Tax=Penicillium canariense TaxID=189055 RepID=A0A9W9IJ68_9EURO|nr:uncharacterized protein N7482_001133 [Penicillium canariense]KAJ5175256.1 hypothetical protein N7482_001133 [Penicillium canariense]